MKAVLELTMSENKMIEDDASEATPPNTARSQDLDVEPSATPKSKKEEEQIILDRLRDLGYVDD